MKPCIKGRSCFLNPQIGQLILAALLLAFFVATGQATNRVVFDVVRTGTNTPVDTIYTGNEYEIRIHIETDQPLQAIIIPLKVFYNGDPGLICQWNTQSSGYGTSSAITIPPGSYLDPTLMFYLFFGVTEFDMDGIMPDSFKISGWADDIADELPAIPLDHMFTLHFTPTAPDDQITRYLCINKWGNLLSFTDWTPTSHTPQLNGKCWPVVNRNPDNGDVNCDGGVNVGDAVHLINYIFKNGPPPCQ